MSQQRTYLDYILDIQDALHKVAIFIDGMTFDEFVQDDKTAFAVVRAFEVIGEAAKRTPDSVRAQYPSIPWREMAQMRDKLIHHYFGVDLRIIWKTAQEDLPALSPLIDQVVREMQRENKQ